MNHSNVAIIPARKGSKRLPGKNIKKLGDKPLIAWTIEAAMTSNCFEEIIVTTDDENVRQIAEEYRIQVDQRPPELASDKATVTHALLELIERKLKGQFDACTVLLPTTPFRNAVHIQEAIALLTEDHDAVISVKEYEFNPECAFREESLFFESMVQNNPLFAGVTRKQEQKKYYHPNGAIYTTWLDKYVQNKSFFIGNLGGYKMDDYCSVDIDTMLDFRLASLLLSGEIEI